MTVNSVTPLEASIEQIITASVQNLGYIIVRVKYHEKSHILQIMIERNDDQAITLDDCEKCTDVISAILDVEDLIQTQYSLELSSPGIDRPLMRIEDFIRFSGHDIKATLSQAVENKRRIKGKLLGVHGNIVQVQLEENILNIPFEIITSAQLLLDYEFGQLSTNKHNTIIH
jgi:ribosome maturation factor RimP